MTQNATPPNFQETFSTSLEKVLTRLADSTRGLVQKGALAGTLSLATLLGLPGCEPAAPTDTDEPIDDTPGSGKADWAQDQGRRDPNMVAYLNQYWHEYTNYNGRFGYQGVDVFIKLKVKRVDGANIAAKKVGVEYRIPGFPSKTALGTYFATVDGGYEEWHVRVSLATSNPHAFMFNAWYQDGTYENGRVRTFYNDNNGEFFPIAYDGPYNVVRQDWSQTAVKVGPAGIQGKISMVVADLDFDKDVRIRYTTDDWKTTKEIAMGGVGTKNAVFFDGKLGTGQERWTANLDLPGAVTRMQYAIVYKHGVVAGAMPFEFWDNNGGTNYTVTAP